jgi:hypothetical protein
MYIYFTSILDFVNVFQTLLEIEIQNFHGINSEVEIISTMFSFTSYCYNIFEQKLTIIEYSQMKKEMKNF